MGFGVWDSVLPVFLNVNDALVRVLVALEGGGGRGGLIGGGGGGGERHKYTCIMMILSASCVMMRVRQRS